MIKDIIQNVYSKHPLVHNITNYVAATDCANITLTIGASPIMADEPKEVGEVTQISDGLVLNCGTISESRLNAMLISGKTAKSREIPIVLDPVGVGISKFRTSAVHKIITEVKPDIIRLNASELKSICLNIKNMSGVDAVNIDSFDDTVELAKKLSLKTNAIIGVSGISDIVTDGKIQVSGNTAITIYARYKADTETVYTVTVDGIEKGKYTYGSYVTVTAEDIEGKEFAGWYINGTLVSYDKAYSFYVTGNVALEARYSDTAVVKEPVITLLVSERKDMANGKQSVILTASWSADSSYTFVGAGIILSQNADAELTLENVDGKNVVKTDTRLTSNEGTYAYTLTLGTTAKLKDVYAVAYFTFIKDGKVVTIYTAVQTA